MPLKIWYCLTYFIEEKYKENAKRYYFYFHVFDRKNKNCEFSLSSTKDCEKMQMTQLRSKVFKHNTIV